MKKLKKLHIKELQELTAKEMNILIGGNNLLLYEN